jgi:hypothetical protein
VRDLVEAFEHLVHAAVEQARAARQLRAVGEFRAAGKQHPATGREKPVRLGVAPLREQREEIPDELAGVAEARRAHTAWAIGSSRITLPRGCCRRW